MMVDAKNDVAADVSALSRALISTRAVTTNDVADRVGIPCDLSLLPKIILSIGPCRSGTTVFLRVFAASGVPATGKPFKAILRWLLQESDDQMARTWQLPSAQTVYFKEPIGPYSIQECEFNPLHVLHRVYTRAERCELRAIDRLRRDVILLITGRVPEHCWLSWLTKYGTFVPREILFRNFLASHMTVSRIRSQALAWNVPTKHYMLEAHMQAEAAVSRLFIALGLPRRPVISGWKELPPFPGVGSDIEIPDHPSIYDRAGRFDKILNSDGLIYFSKSNSELQAIPADERSTIQDTIMPLYLDWKRSAELELGIHIPQP